MQLAQIKSEIARVVPHEIMCSTRKKVDPGECNCSHVETVKQIHQLFIDVLKQRR